MKSAELTEAELTALALLGWLRVPRDDRGCTARDDRGCTAHDFNGNYIFCGENAALMRNPIRWLEPPNLICIRHARWLLEGHEA